MEKTYGGAISTTGTNTTLNNNTFINNTANSTASNSYGGAIATTGESETRNSNITITNTEFKNNTASGNIESYGGAISTIGSSLAIDTVNFTQNKAEAKTDNSYGGAISTTGESEIKNSDITITNSNFTNNSISSRIRSYGGAISGINQNLKVNLTNFTDNQATSSSKSYGGAIAITGANLTLTNSTLDKNSATSTNTSYGGTIATTGESEIRNSNLTVSYTTFLNNTSKIGGGIYGKNNILNLTFSAFNNNTAENSVNLADENVTLILRGNYFAQVDSIYDSNITAQVNGNNAVALLNQTTPSPLKVVLVEKDSNQTITKLGNNYMLEVSSIPDDLITKVNLTVENGYSSDVEFKPLPADSNMKVYTEYTLVAIMNHDANLTISVTTPVNTVGNVTANVDVTENGNPVNGNVIFTINGETYNVTIVDGKAQLNYTLPSDIQAGEHNITAELENPMYNANNMTGNFTVLKINIANTTIEETIKTLENYTLNTIIKDANGNQLVGVNQIAVKMNGKTFMHGTITDGVLNITFPTDSMEAKVYNLTIIIGENNIYKTGQITGKLTIQRRDVTVKVEVNNPYTLSDLLANVTVTENGILMKDGAVIFKINGLTLKDENGNEIMANVINGHASLNYTLSYKYSAYPSTSTGMNNFTAVYINNYYNANSDTVDFKITPTTIPDMKFDNINILTGENTTINITVRDINNKTIVANKKIAVKINGKTIIHDNITDGKIYLNIPTDQLAKGQYNLLIIIGTNSIYSNASYTMIIDIQKRNASIETQAFTNGKTLSLVTKVTSNESFIDENVVIYKLNGVTLKDEDGNIIKVNVKNGLASLDYELPGITTAINYNLTSVYVNNFYYNRCEEVETISIPKIAIPSISLNDSIISKGQNLSISTTLKDAYNDTLKGLSNIDIKINGNNVMKTSIMNGKLNITIPTDKLKAGNYEIIIIIKEGSKYFGTVDLMNLKVAT